MQECVHLIQLVWTYAVDKSLNMQIPSVDLCMRLFLLVFVDVMQLHNSNADDCSFKGVHAQAQIF